MPLTEQQIEELFSFTKKKYVHYYDLQQELVDHLACSIEEEMAADQQLSFENALQKVYSRFGIFGFAKVVQEREAALAKQNKRIWWIAVKAFFTVPKIALTATVFFGALLLGEYLDPVLKDCLVILTSLVYVSIDIGERLTTRKTCKKLLLMRPTGFSSMIPICFPYYSMLIDWSKFENNYLFATFIALIVIVETAVIQVNQQVRWKARQLYPEAFVAA